MSAVADLDNHAAFGTVDRSGALADVEATPDQWAAPFDAAPIDLSSVRCVVVTGMGGSGIVGDVAACLAGDASAVPVMVHRGYGMPAFVGPDTLVIAVSSSGRTEETRSAVEAAATRGARIVAVAGPGPLSSAAGVQVVSSPPAGPQPRHSLGAMARPVLGVLGLDDGIDEAVHVTRRIVVACGRDVPTAENPAKQLAVLLAGGGLPVVWGTAGLAEVAAYRMACQLNENAKLLALHGVIPELNHNQVVGWQEPTPAIGGLVVLRDPAGEHERVAARVGVSVDLVRDRVAWTHELPTMGDRPLARLAALLLLVDLTSVYTAIALGRDPTPIPSIDALKAALG